MDKGSNKRTGKVISGHSTRIEGLNRLLKELEQWPEISSIRLGSIMCKNKVGRKSKRLKVDPSSQNGLRAAQSHKRAKGGGGFSFRATRPAMVGSTVTGIKCDASNGTHTQQITLCGDDLEALKRRLQVESYGANW
jgi:hypothetical protein